MARTEQGTLDRYPIARTTKPCERYPCRGLIWAGERYLVTALPPDVDPNSSGAWWTMRICARCHPAVPAAAGVVIRPNGRAYVPRKPPRAVFAHGNACVPDAVYVLGTHDEEHGLDLALRVAGVDPSPEPPTWVRLGMVNGEQVYVRDQVRGAAALIFEAI